MKNSNTELIRTAFLRASYCALFGACPDAAVIDQLMLETNENGKQES